MAFIAPLAVAAMAGGGSLLAGTGVATALTAASAGLAGVSAIQNGQYQAAVAKNNAQIAEANAARESEASQREAMRSDREYAAELGEVMAAQGASGLDILGRTQIATRNLQRRVGREAAGDIRDRGTAASRRLQQDAANFRAEGAQAKRQGYLSAAGSLLKGGVAVADDMGWGRSLVTKTRRRRF